MGSGTAATRGQRLRKKKTRRAERKKRSAGKRSDRGVRAGGSILAPARVAGPPSDLNYLHPYDSSASLFGVEAVPHLLIAKIRRFSWKDSFFRLASLAASVANSDGPLSERVRKVTIDPILTDRRGPPGPFEKARAEISRRGSSIAVAHEEVISFLQHLVLLEGADDGQAPADVELTIWMATANTFLRQWAVIEPDITEDELLAADLVQISRFNNKPDPVRVMARIFWMYDTKPPSGRKLSAGDEWECLQLEAFGTSFRDYFATALAPLYMLSSGWGRGSAQNEPIVNVATLVSETGVPAEVFAALIAPMSATREAIRSQVTTRADGLPSTLVPLLERPFIEIETGVYVVASPWMMNTALHSGVWARMLSASKKLYGKRAGPENVWLPAFGEIVESWCWRVADEAQKTCEVARIITPPPDARHEEVEDVIVVEKDVVILFSVKARLMAVDVARNAVSPRKTLNWFDDFLFAKADGRYAKGALRLLDDKIRKLREGKFEKAGIKRNAEVVPVLVTYDTLGEHRHLYQRIEAQCRATGVLQQERVAPIAFARLEEFEVMMARLSRGEGLVDVLKSRGDVNQHRRLDQILAETAPTDGPYRLPFLEELHTTVMDLIFMRLYGKPFPARRNG
jgi:hypothetical protein